MLAETPPKTTRLHIVGFPRSGTTLLTEIIATCFENRGACEHEMSIFTPPPQDAKLYFSKKPTDIRYIMRLLDRDPNLYVICLFRDPRSVITSIHKSTTGKYFCNYQECNCCQLTAESLKGNDRFLMIQYEALTKDPNEIQKHIENTFPFLTRTHDFTDYSKIAKPSEKSQNALNGVRPINTERHEGWKKHRPRLKSEIERHPQITDDLIRLGYEPNHDWMSQLESVTSQRFDCRSSANRLSLKERKTKIRKYFQHKSQSSQKLTLISRKRVHSRSTIEL